jgi:hypothetical protein
VGFGETGDHFWDHCLLCRQFPEVWEGVSRGSFSEAAEPMIRATLGATLRREHWGRDLAHALGKITNFALHGSLALLWPELQSDGRMLDTVRSLRALGALGASDPDAARRYVDMGDDELARLLEDEEILRALGGDDAA